MTEIRFASTWLDRVAALNDPKLPPGWQEQYAARVNRDFAEILPWLPEPIGRVIDIGCGFAGIDVLLARSDATDIHLIDGSAVGIRRVGFDAAMTPWRDVELGAQLVRDNAPDRRVTTETPPAQRVSAADLVISLKSWGHHYPVGVYVDYARRCLRPGGVLILDVRAGTNGRGELEAAGFAFLGRAGGTVKTDRLVFCA